MRLAGRRRTWWRFADELTRASQATTLQPRCPRHCVCTKENSPQVDDLQGVNGEGGIRTPGTDFSPYNGLANRRLQPLGHLSSGVMIDAVILADAACLT